MHHSKIIGQVIPAICSGNICRNLKLSQSTELEVGLSTVTTKCTSRPHTGVVWNIYSEWWALKIVVTVIFIQLKLVSHYRDQQLLKHMGHYVSLNHSIFIVADHTFVDVDHAAHACNYIVCPQCLISGSWRPTYLTATVDIGIFATYAVLVILWRCRPSSPLTIVDLFPRGVLLERDKNINADIPAYNILVVLRN